MPRTLPHRRLPEVHVPSPVAQQKGRSFSSVHQVVVSVPEQVSNLMSLLESRGIGQWASFRDLVADCGAPIEIVGRFLALLELYRARAVAFEQPEALGVLQISWTGERPNHQHLAVEEDHYD